MKIGSVSGEMLKSGEKAGDLIFLLFDHGTGGAHGKVMSVFAVPCGELMYVRDQCRGRGTEIRGHVYLE